MENTKPKFSAQDYVDASKALKNINEEVGRLTNEGKLDISKEIVTDLVIENPVLKDLLIDLNIDAFKQLMSMAEIMPIAFAVAISSNAKQKAQAMIYSGNTDIKIEMLDMTGCMKEIQKILREE